MHSRPNATGVLVHQELSQGTRVLCQESSETVHLRLHAA